MEENNKYLIREIAKVQTDSFNFFLSQGIYHSLADVGTFSFSHLESNVQIKVNTIQIGTPSASSISQNLFPNECRESGLTYASILFANLTVTIDGSSSTFDQTLGRLPIMVKSSKCRLHKLSQKQLIAHHEDGLEQGGYFIINGHEKLVRLFIAPRSNQPVCMFRPSFSNRGKGFTPQAVMIRGIRKDLSYITNTLHFLVDGSAQFRVIIDMKEYFFPVGVILKAFVETNDREIYKKILQSRSDNVFWSDCVQVMLKDDHSSTLFNQTEALTLIGSKFQTVLAHFGAAPHLTDVERGQFFLKTFILVHLTSSEDKFDLLIFMIQKLLAFVTNECSEESVDLFCNQEIITSGQIYGIFFRDLIRGSYNKVVSTMRILHLRTKDKTTTVLDLLKKALTQNFELGTYLTSFLTTGSVPIFVKSEIVQRTGLSIEVDRINYLRFISLFRSIHRGSFFQESRISGVRKLLPEVWGFVCCVHTPDGAPCGILNHLAVTCEISAGVDDRFATELPQLLFDLGMIPKDNEKGLHILLDGRIVGKILSEDAPEFVSRLRYLKATGHSQIPPLLEVAFVPPMSSTYKQYPGIFLFTTPHRPMRPVRHLQTGKVEYIGSLEQVFLRIAIFEHEIKKDESINHQELHPSNILDIVPQLTPFPDYNQSPRNMYQCQMGKQTLGTPEHSMACRSATKTYRIQTPQKPLVYTNAQEQFSINDYPHGANAVVAVISYTGYDMEDAMVINKSSYERGFAHGSVYKNLKIDLTEEAAPLSKLPIYFTKNGPTTEKSNATPTTHLDEDGLPFIGTLLTEGMPAASWMDENNGKLKQHIYKQREPAYVDQVRLFKPIITSVQSKDFAIALLKLRYNRNPVVGDKFASRHGQKGVLSQLWPDVNMPFTESGMRPDLIINPNAFPSRMTIGMFIESMAGKSAALHGMFQNGTVFNFTEQNTASSYFGNQLLKAGFNYYGNEPMYSGTKGVEFKADIFIGVVYYQRLRHMVKDKFQARTTGPINSLTHQPIKGRKKGGGIRFGEMERDSLIAHGASYLLNDRLFLSSDASVTQICANCKSLISPVSELLPGKDSRRNYCRLCLGTQIYPVLVPYVLRYLMAELMSLNIRIDLDLK